MLRPERDDSKLARVAAMDIYGESVSRWRGRLIENAEVAALWEKTLTDEVVDGIDDVRLQIYSSTGRILTEQTTCELVQSATTN